MAVQAAASIVHGAKAFDADKSRLYDATHGALVLTFACLRLDANVDAQASVVLVLVRVFWAGG